MATRYLFTSTAFLALGAILWLGSLMSMRFPGLFPFSFGHLRPAALTALLLGWLVLGLMAGICYVLPRLTASPLRGGGIAQLGLIAGVGVVLGGMAIVLIGFGDGREPFAFPWWWDLPTLGLLSLPAMVVFSSLRHRREPMIYPTLWFVVGTSLCLPVLYVIGNLPGLRSLATSLGELVFSAGVVNMWGIGLATGLVYYVLPKTSGQPLFNRQLARVGFWSLMFGAIWMGPAQVVGGPAPEWLQGVAAVLGLALPVGAIANTVNFALTIGPKWVEIGRKPVMLAAIVGSGFATLGSIIVAIGGFRSAGVVVGFTIFWEGVLNLLLFGAAAFLFVAFAWQAVPNLVGRSLYRESRAVQAVRRGALAVGVTSILLLLAGMAAGYGWAGASFTGLLKPFGSGWVELSELPSVLTLLAVLTAFPATWYMVRLAISIYQSLTSGRPVVQEVLMVETEGPPNE